MKKTKKKPLKFPKLPQVQRTGVGKVADSLSLASAGIGLILGLYNAAKTVRKE